MSMTMKIAVVGTVFLVAAVLAIGALAYSFLKPVEAADGPIQAIPIASTAPSATPTSAVAAVTPPTSGSGSTVAATTTGTTATTTYTIVQSSSQARFVIDEVLSGAAKTVIGSTDQVAGQITVNPTAPTGAQIGTIQINARTLATDSAPRDNAIKNQILKTNDSQYITFVPTSVTGLPTTATIGQAYTFQIVGQLTIAGTTKEATFAVTATPNADGTLGGSAKTTVKYADWRLAIPNMPFVTGVSDTLSLELDFVARAS